MALSPSDASPTTSNPSASSRARALARKLGWSSTIRTLVTFSMVAQRWACLNTANHTLCGRSDAEALEHRFVSPPFRPCFDAELEIRLPAEQRLHLGPGARADFPDHG